MKTTTLLLIGGGLVLAYIIVKQTQATPVSAGAQAIKTGAGILGSITSWWQKSYVCDDGSQPPCL